MTMEGGKEVLWDDGWGVTSRDPFAATQPDVAQVSLNLPSSPPLPDQPPREVLRADPQDSGNPFTKTYKGWD